MTLSHQWELLLLFFCTTALRKILIKNNIIKRCIPFVNQCFISKCTSETVNHLLIHCTVAIELWALVFPKFRIWWVMPKRVIKVIFGWCSWFSKHRSSSAQNGSTLCLMWTILRERNKPMFNDKETTILELKSSFLSELFERSQVIGPSGLNSMINFVDSLSFRL